MRNRVERISIAVAVVLIAIACWLAWRLIAPEWTRVEAIQVESL